MSNRTDTDISFEESGEQFRALLREQSMEKAQEVIANSDMISRGLDEVLTQQHKPIPEHQFQFGDIGEESSQQPEAERGDMQDEAEDGPDGEGKGSAEQGQIPGPGLPYEMPGEEAGEGEGDAFGPSPGEGEGEDGGEGEGDAEGGEQAGQGSADLTFEDNPTIWDYLEHELPRINLNLEDLEVGPITRQEYIDIRGRMREGPMVLLDAKATIMERVKRRIGMGLGPDEIIRFASSDFRYHRPHLGEEPVTRVVLFLVMDTSGSMTELRKYLARLAGLIEVLVLRGTYDVVELRFIIHDGKAHEVSEAQWHTKAPAGGTMISSGIEKVWEIFQAEYAHGWEAYLQIFSDGDNTMTDNPKVERLLRSMLPLFNLIAFLRIQGSSTDMQRIAESIGKDFDNYAFAHIAKKEQLGPALTDIWAKDAKRKKRKGAQ